MRVLFSCVPGFGHFHPMVPLAQGLAVAGHDVAFATAERFCRRVVAPTGFKAFSAGPSPAWVYEETVSRSGAAGVGEEDVWGFGAHMFADVAAAAKIADLARITDEWSPDLVVHDMTDFAAPVAAADAGIPWAGQSFGALQPFDFWEPAAELVAPLWRRQNVEPLPLGGMFHHLYLDICPPSFQASWIDRVATARPLRPVPFDTSAGGRLPLWVRQLPEAPTVYVTLGTIMNQVGGVFEAVLEGLSAEPYNVIVTVGPDRDPAELGPQPENVHVESYLPQSLLFPHCDLVLCHGGSGTTLAALAHGLPLLVLPQGANQFWNAERCAELGVGAWLPESDLDPEEVRASVARLLAAGDYRRRARDLQREIDRMPGPAQVVDELEELAAK